MVQLKRKGYVQLLLNPYVLGLLAFLGLGGFVSSHLSLPTLSIGQLGFDDYMIYDGFKKDYIDMEKWEYWEHGVSKWSDTDKRNHEAGYISIRNGAFYAHSSSGVSVDNTDAINRREALDLIPTDHLYGRHIKTKLTAGRSDTGDYYATSTVSVILNNRTIYTVKEDTYNREDQYQGASTSAVIELHPSFLYEDIFEIVVNGEHHDTVNVSGNGDQQLRFRFRPKGDYHADLKDKLWGKIHYVKYKHQYSCQIADDETLVFDSFAAGSEINISALSFEPEQFCLDYPVKARSFEENGIKTDRRGELLQRIVEGESFTVPDNEEWKVFYITKYNESMELRCDINEAYDTQAGGCVDPNKQQLHECETDSDCYVPLGCTGITATCAQNHTCQYSSSCEPEKVYVDQCSTDADCDPPCPGMTATCEAPDNKGKRCVYEGKCNPEVIQCQSESDCPGAPCDGMERVCMDNACSYEGECQPATSEKKSSPWSWIFDNAFFSWLGKLW